MTSNENMYDKLLTSLVLENGTVSHGRRAGADWSFVSSYDVQQHVLGGWAGGTRAESFCGWDMSQAEVDESANWREDGDSFHEGSEVVGMSVRGLACRCGLIVGIEVQWKANPSEAIHAVMRRLAEIGALDLRGVRDIAL